MIRLLICLTYILFLTACGNQTDIIADEHKRVTLDGLLIFDGEFYSLKLNKKIRCLDMEGGEELETIGIGHTKWATEKYRFLGDYINKQIALEGVVYSPRGGCSFHDVELIGLEKIKYHIRHLIEIIKIYVIL